MLFSRRQLLVQAGRTVAVSPGAASALIPALAALARTTAVAPEIVRLRPEIEPVVRWIEGSERSQLFSRAADELARGLPYRELLAGLFLAGIRNIEPRPVGFKFHAVMVINSAHQLSLDAPLRDRLYPLFWALDNFKRSQEQDVREGDWWLGPAREPALPAPTAARQRLVEALEAWDEEAADAAVAALCRSAGATEIMETLWPYGARNYRNIGHNIIFTAQSFRTLQVIGFQHAEPVLRSLVYGILDGTKGEASALPFEENRRRAARLRADWLSGSDEEEATIAFLEVLRTGTTVEASEAVVTHSKAGLSAGALWDGVLLAAAELLLRSPGIVSLHAWTACNSLHYAFRASGIEATRRLMLLQAAAWLPTFRDDGRRQATSQLALDSLEPAGAGPELELTTIFERLTSDRLAAARAVLAFAVGGGSSRAFMDVGRNLVFRKGTDVHDYKFSAAAFEEILHASPRWQPHLMAASVYSLRGAAERDSALVERTHQALARLA